MPYIEFVIACSTLAMPTPRREAERFSLQSLERPAMFSDFACPFLA